MTADIATCGHRCPAHGTICQLPPGHSTAPGRHQAVVYGLIGLRGNSVDDLFVTDGAVHVWQDHGECADLAAAPPEGTAA